MATVNSIALALIVEQGEATDDSDYVAQVETWVNDALDEIAIATNWNHFRARDTFDTEIGEPQYTLPAGGRAIIQLRYTATGEPINLWTVQEAARRSVKLEDDGHAVLWLEDGVITSGSNVLYQYRLVPTPTEEEEIEVEYFYHPSNVASGTVLPVQDNLLVLVKDRTRVFILERDQKYDAADRCQRRFDKNLAELVRTEKRKIAQNTQMRACDIRSIRMPEALLDPNHYRN